jgi:hypothetical protein
VSQEYGTGATPSFFAVCNGIRRSIFVARQLQSF